MDDGRDPQDRRGGGAGPGVAPSWWFRGVEKRHEGHIEAGGVGKDVRFVAEPDRDINDRIDEVYPHLDKQVNTRLRAR